MTETVVRRVVIACDAVGENRSSIEVAARLAAWWNAALYGIFVEDEGLLNLAALPFARHIGPSGEISDDLDVATILHQFEAHAERVRAALEAAAREHAIAWSFDVVRGQPALTTLPLGDQDLLVIEAASRPFASDFRLESRWLAAALAAQHSVLLTRHADSETDGIIALVQQAGASAEGIIATAARLALAGKRSLTIVRAGTAPDEATILDQLRPISDRLAAQCRIERPADLSASLRNFAGESSLLIVDADPAVNDATALKDLSAQTRSDILFLR